MALHPQKFCELTDLQYDNSAKTYWGTLQGYPVFLTVIPRRDTVVFRLIAKAPSEDAAAAIPAQANDWCASHAAVTGLIYKDRSLTAAISLTPRETEENLSAVTAGLISFAAGQGLIPCCMSCGTESGYRAYLLDNGGVTACDSCKPYIEQKIREAEANAAAVKPDVIGLAVGAVLGAVLVFTLTYFVLKLSYLSMLTGYAGVLLGLFLMRKLGKKLTVPAVACCAVLCMLAGVAGSVLHFAGLIADYNAENAAEAQQVCDAYDSLEELIATNSEADLPDELSDLSQYQQMNEQAKCILSHTDTVSCLRDLPQLLKIETYSALKPELIKCLIFTLISILACIALSAPPMLKADQGRHTLRELPE